MRWEQQEQQEQCWKVVWIVDWRITWLAAVYEDALAWQEQRRATERRVGRQDWR